MRMLSNEQIEELTNIVDYYTTWFIGDKLGGDMLSKKDRSLLKSFGVDLKLFEDNTGFLETAFKFGMLARKVGKPLLKKLTFSELKKYFKSGNFHPLSTIEKYALDFVKKQAYSDIKGLGNRIARDTLQVFIELSKANRIKYENTIRKETVAAVKERKTIKELSSALGEKTKDWSRDFDRIADYLMHSAYQQGIATELLNTVGGEAEVFYTVYKGACKHCQRVYILNGNTGEPKVFKLKDVIANGSNIGRKAEDYLPSVDPLHPWCRCTMHLKPENSVWSTEKQQFIIVRNTYGVKRKSKVKVTITKE